MKSFLFLASCALLCSCGQMVPKQDRSPASITFPQAMASISKGFVAARDAQVDANGDRVQAMLAAYKADISFRVTAAEMGSQDLGVDVALPINSAEGNIGFSAKQSQGADNSAENTINVEFRSIAFKTTEKLDGKGIVVERTIEIKPASEILSWLNVMQEMDSSSSAQGQSGRSNSSSEKGSAASSTPIVPGTTNVDPTPPVPPTSPVAGKCGPSKVYIMGKGCGTFILDTEVK